MPQAKTTRKSGDRLSAFGQTSATPGILVAYAPEGSCSVDRCAVTPPFTMGRGSENSLSLNDEKVSGRHCRIQRDANGYWLEDLGSTNGTFLDGEPVAGHRVLADMGVIRIGGSVLVFHQSAGMLLAPPPLERYGIWGPFHAGPLVQTLREAELSLRHLLIAGPSGVGKELAAQTLATMAGDKLAPLKLVAHNAARFTSEDEATATLFGVGANVFTNVEKRSGLIEHANNGILFLDEVHNLPVRVQRGLLRVIEDGIATRIGELAPRKVNVRFVFASNAAPPSYSLAPDLLARLRTIAIPSLRERVADVPRIFLRLLERSLANHKLGANDVLPLLGGDHFEAIALDGFEDENVRGLIDLTDRLSTRIRSGVPPQEAIQTVFAERFYKGPVASRYAEKRPSGRGSHYEQNREMITAVFRECGGNLTATQKTLHARGLKCNRRWLGVFVDQWGLRANRKS